MIQAGASGFVVDSRISQVLTATGVWISSDTDGIRSRISSAIDVSDMVLLFRIIFLYINKNSLTGRNVGWSGVASPTSVVARRFSAYADQAELLAWHRQIGTPECTCLVHAVEKVMQHFATKLLPDTKVEMPVLGQSFNLWCAV